jgi:uncharacterized protein
VIRAVVDPGVLVSALITPAGVPAQLMEAARAERFDLVASPRVLEELAGVLRREIFRKYVTVAEVEAFVAGLARLSELVADVDEPPRISRDPSDDYLVALTLAASASALVSGDSDLLSIDDPDLAVLSPREFLQRLDR